MPITPTPPVICTPWVKVKWERTGLVRWTSEMMSSTNSAVASVPPAPATVSTSSNVCGLPGGTICHHSRIDTWPPNAATTSSTALAVPLWRSTSIAIATRLRLTSSVQYDFQLSTDSPQANQGNSSAGMVAGFQSVASGTGMSSSCLAVPSRPRSISVLFGGSKLVTDPPIVQGDLCAVRRLRVTDDDVRGGADQVDVLNAGDGQCGVDRGKGDIAPQTARLIGIGLGVRLGIRHGHGSVRAGKAPHVGLNLKLDNLGRLHADVVRHGTDVIGADIASYGIQQRLRRGAIALARQDRNKDVARPAGRVQ